MRAVIASLDRCGDIYCGHVQSTKPRSTKDCKNCELKRNADAKKQKEKEKMEKKQKKKVDRSKSCIVM